MLQKMSSILVVGLRMEATRIVDTLYHEGTVHLVECPPAVRPAPGNSGRSTRSRSSRSTNCC